jgi:hypothetical protein
MFNKKPNKGVQCDSRARCLMLSGIKMLQDSGFITADPKDVARFLHSEDRLDRGAVMSTDPLMSMQYVLVVKIFVIPLLCFH